MTIKLMPSEKEFELMQRIAKVYAHSLGEKVEDILYKMLRAYGLGLPITEARELFNTVHGDETLSASTLATLMKRAGYHWFVRELTDQIAEIAIYDATGAHLGDSTFAITDAQQAKTWNKKKNEWQSIYDSNTSWKHYPRNMLMARALSNAVRWYAPDALAGAAIYTPEELGDTQDTGFAVEDNLEWTDEFDEIENVEVQEIEPETASPAKPAPPADEPTIGDTNKYLFAVIGVWAKFYGYTGDAKDIARKEFAHSNGFKVDSFADLTDEQRIALALRFKQDLVFSTAKQRADGALALDKEQELVAWATNNRKGAKMIEDLSAAECDKILKKWKEAE